MKREKSLKILRSSNGMHLDVLVPNYYFLGPNLHLNTDNQSKKSIALITYLYAQLCLPL